VALLPLLLIQLAVFQPQGMSVTSLSEALFMAVMILFMSPIIFVCFLLGAAAIGPLSYTGLKLFQRADAAVAAGIAGLSSTIAIRLMMGTAIDNEIVTAVAIAGAVGGLVFQQRLDQSFKPRPAPSS
jgi:hypothetical protein